MSSLTKQQYLALLEAEYLHVASNSTFALTTQSMAILADIFTSGSRNRRYLLNLLSKFDATQFTTIWPLIKGKLTNGIVVLVPFYTSHFPMADNADILKRLSKITVSKYHYSNWKFRGKKLTVKIDIALVSQLPAIGRFKALHALKDCADNPFTDRFTRQELSDLLFAATFGAKNNKYQQQVNEIITHWKWYK